jgi:hypothetical protein
LVGLASASEWKRDNDGCGTIFHTPINAASERMPMRMKMPGMVRVLYSVGPAASEKAKVRPMLMPIIAIAWVRFSSLVKSASSAVMAAEMAPEPCTARPRIIM